MIDLELSGDEISRIIEAAKAKDAAKQKTEATQAGRANLRAASKQKLSLDYQSGAYGSLRSLLETTGDRRDQHVASCREWLVGMGLTEAAFASVMTFARDIDGELDSERVALMTCLAFGESPRGEDGEEGDDVLEAVAEYPRRERADDRGQTFSTALRDALGAMMTADDEHARSFVRPVEVRDLARVGATVVTPAE